MAELVRLRPIEPGDLETLFRYDDDPDARAMAAFVPPRDRAAFDAHWKHLLADPAVVARVIVEGEHVVGNVVSFVHEGRRQVGYWVGREHWGRGLATAALRALLALLPERPLYAGCAKDNRGSSKVLARCGFVILREAQAHAPARGGEITELLWVLEAPSRV